MEASYSVQWVRPSVYIDTAGQAVNGFSVRVALYPWNEIRDLNVPDDDPDIIQEHAEAAIIKRAAMDKLSENIVELKD